MSTILSSTTDKLELVTSSAADIDYLTCYTIADKTSSPMVVKDADNKSGAIASATTTDVSGSPAAANDRWSLGPMRFRNKHASTQNDLTLRHVKAGGTAREILKVTLYAGWELWINKDGVAFVYDQSGAVVMGQVLASDTVAGLIEIASQAELEAGTDVARAVTPGRQHFHPSACKAHGIVTVSGGTPTLQTSYNITSITDTATCRLTVTIATDFSGTNYAIIPGMEASTTTYSATTTSLITVVRNATRAAGSFVLDALEIDIGQATDPAAWTFACFGDL